MMDRRALLTCVLLAMPLLSCDKDATTSEPTPMPPGALFARQHSSGIALNWIDHSTNETSFEVEFARGSDSYALIASLPANTTVFTHEDIEPVLYHKYRVRACNALGCSPYSNESGRNGSYKPAAPTVLAFNLNGNIVGQAFLVVRFTTGAVRTRVIFEWAPAAETFGTATRMDPIVVEPSFDVDGYLRDAMVNQSLRVVPGERYQARAILENSEGADTTQAVTFTARAN